MVLGEKNDQYVLGFLDDSTGRFAAPFPGACRFLAPEVNTRVLEALRRRSVEFCEFFLAGSGENCSMDLLVPLLVPQGKDTAIVGLLALRINPASALFPLVQAWPLPSKTAGNDPAAAARGCCAIPEPSQ